MRQETIVKNDPRELPKQIRKCQNHTTRGMRKIFVGDEMLELSKCIYICIWLCRIIGYEADILRHTHRFSNALNDHLIKHFMLDV